jgi:hypothetical protein
MLSTKRGKDPEKNDAQILSLSPNYCRKMFKLADLLPLNSEPQIRIHGKRWHSEDLRIRKEIVYILQRSQLECVGGDPRRSLQNYDFSAIRVNPKHQDSTLGIPKRQVQQRLETQGFVQALTSDIESSLR